MDGFHQFIININLKERVGAEYKFDIAMWEGGKRARQTGKQAGGRGLKKVLPKEFYIIVTLIGRLILG